ncbi:MULTISPECIES: collagen-like protein [unclassified Paenibacillus]|uniref:BclA C-terminal domain-containing protein n=1 Tax=unclassified Paenibacillus TaxID=185978 RepID=UPI00384B9155
MTGATGAIGVAGNVGAAGTVGAAGAVGTAGNVGAAGNVGTAGTVGTAGNVGAAGAVGTAGAVGAAGAVGPVGPVGPAGIPGAVGPAGPAGVAGAVGPVGPAGAVGATGATGTAGATGSTGATGATGTAGGIAQFGYIYNLGSRVVPIEADVIFDTNGILTPGITHAPGTTQIAVTDAGNYEVNFSVSGVEPGQFAIFINGTLAAGTIYGSGAGTQQNTGQAILALASGDVLTLRNHSSAAAVTLQTLAGGTQANVNASVVIKKLS